MRDGKALDHNARRIDHIMHSAHIQIRQLRMSRHLHAHGGTQSLRTSPAVACQNLLRVWLLSNPLEHSIWPVQLAWVGDLAYAVASFKSRR